MQHEIAQKIYHILTQITDADLSRVVVEVPKDPTHGDYACNAAMVLTKVLGQPPRQLAQAIADKISDLPEVESVNIAGPGFINFFLKTSVWQRYLEKVLQEGGQFGQSALGENALVNVEYVSANPTGPMHVGHCRNAVLGDVMATLLERIGFRVCREYYINDAGNQVANLGRSAYLRYQQALGLSISEDAFEGDLYPGDYLIPVGQALAQEFGDQYANQPESQWLPVFRQRSVDLMMDLIRADLQSLGVVMDVFTSENAVVSRGLLDEGLAVLTHKGDIYTGVLEPPKGHTIEDWEERPQTLFRATTYGDDVDRPLKKSDGTWTYFAGDIAYHLDKHQRGFDQMINIFGADHAGYIKRLTAAVTAVTQGKGSVEVKATQLVNLFENGQPVRMSKRSGNFVRLSDVVERVGKDATRFMMVSRRHDMTIDFDFQKVLEQSRENPIFYVQYAHARACSVLRHGKELWPAVTTFNHFQLLTDDAELAMIKQLAQWPKVLEQAALMREPHRIPNFLLDVAAEFHGLWNKGKDAVHLRFIDPHQETLSQARLGLVKAVALVIACGLNVLGIEPVQEMR